MTIDSCSTGAYPSYIHSERPKKVKCLNIVFLEFVMAVGTGFGQLFRGIDQVDGVGILSAIFQTILDWELRQRIRTPDAEDVSDFICLSNYPSSVDRNEQVE
jgi:hypothetical protein